MASSAAQAAIWLFLCLVSAPVLAPDLSGFPFATTLALADDDDGYDDGDDSGDDGGEGHEGTGLPAAGHDSVPGSPTASSDSQVPDALPDELIVGGLGEAELATLTALGLVVIAQSTASAGGRIMARLRLPPGLGLAAARQRLNEIAPAATVDSNHFYRPAGTP